MKIELQNQDNNTPTDQNYIFCYVFVYFSIVDDQRCHRERTPTGRARYHLNRQNFNIFENHQTYFCCFFFFKINVDAFFSTSIAGLSPPNISEGVAGNAGTRSNCFSRQRRPSSKRTLSDFLDCATGTEGRLSESMNHINHWHSDSKTVCSIVQTQPI